MADGVAKRCKPDVPRGNSLYGPASDELAELMRRQTDPRREIAAAVAPALEPKKRAMVPLSACIAYVTVAFAVGAGMVLMLSLQVR